MKRLILLGASGNIGRQTLQVIKDEPSIELVAFSVGRNIDQIESILKSFKTIKAVYSISKVDALIKKYPSIKFYYGTKGMALLMNEVKADLLFNALVGFVGLEPTLIAIKKNIDIALCNKESLVVGGELIKKALRRSKSKIIPVDSEHSALYKCLQTVKKREVSELILTASGGSFRDLSREQLKTVTVDDALNHPTWQMGNKITIDCATLINKGFEIIEAYYLFNYPIKKIKVLLHKESCVHSIVKLKNNKLIGEVSKPDMKNPIKFALGLEGDSNIKTVNKLNEFGPYHFKEFDYNKYPMVKYARRAIKEKGIMPCVLNATNEVLVNMFLKKQIAFLNIEKIVGLALDTFKNHKHPSLEKLKLVDKEVREWAKTAGRLENLL